MCCSLCLAKPSSAPRSLHRCPFLWEGFLHPHQSGPCPPASLSLGCQGKVWSRVCQQNEQGWGAPASGRGCGLLAWVPAQSWLVTPSSQKHVPGAAWDDGMTTSLPPTTSYCLLRGQLQVPPKRKGSGERLRGAELWELAGAHVSRMLGWDGGSHLWLGTKSRKSRTWVASLERTTWPVNWPGENQKGKSGGSLSWNSAWMLEGKDLAGSGSPGGAELACPPPSAPKPGTHAGMARLWVGQRAGQGAEECVGQGEGRPSRRCPTFRAQFPRAFPGSLADPPLSSHSLSRGCVTWCHSSYAPPSMWMTVTAISPMLKHTQHFSLPPGGSHPFPGA